MNANTSQWRRAWLEAYLQDRKDGPPPPRTPAPRLKRALPPPGAYIVRGSVGRDER